LQLIKKIKKGKIMAIGANKVITLKYKLSDDKGNMIQTTQENEPFVYLSGNSQILPKLEAAVDEMIIGGKKNVSLDSSDAYGGYDEKAIQLVKKDAFPQDAKLEVGMEYMAHGPNGHPVQFVIKEVKEEDITIDFNHPLAGRNLNFDVELVDVRDATEEELQHGHVHGAGGHNH
jgi:FKBP-type peptidyl-prolyl cis-trans isomerase SlyD